MLELIEKMEAETMRKMRNLDNSKLIDIQDKQLLKILSCCLSVSISGGPSFQKFYVNSKIDIDLLEKRLFGMGYTVVVDGNCVEVTW